jgi:hypothetical protein
MKVEVIVFSNGAYSRAEGSNINKFYEQCYKVMNTNCSFKNKFGGSSCVTIKTTLDLIRSVQAVSLLRCSSIIVVKYHLNFH